MSTSAEICYTLIIIISLVLLIWGFFDILKKKQPTEHSQDAVISRQLRGIGLLILSQVVLFLGVAMCFGVTGGGQSVKGMLGMMNLDKAFY